MGDAPLITEMRLAQEVLQQAIEWVTQNIDDCYQDDTESGWRGRRLMEAVQAYVTVANKFRGTKKEK